MAFLHFCWRRTAVNRRATSACRSDVLRLERPRTSVVPAGPRVHVRPLVRQQLRPTVLGTIHTERNPLTLLPVVFRHGDAGVQHPQTALVFGTSTTLLHPVVSPPLEPVGIFRLRIKVTDVSFQGGPGINQLRYSAVLHALTANSSPVLTEDCQLHRKVRCGPDCCDSRQDVAQLRCPGKLIPRHPFCGHEVGRDGFNILHSSFEALATGKEGQIVWYSFWP
mmetsp:Transcript_28080/g.74239  ORF Transcript_28080/g.74239 Transcript_28080/m.74239 type:complete len:222 (+) Transcript_28080:261-926(+)